VSTIPHHRRSERLSLSGATAKQRLGHLEQGALILAAIVAIYAVWLGIGLPALPFQLPGPPRVTHEAPFAVHVDDATPPRARATPARTVKLPQATERSITAAGRRNRPHAGGTTKQGLPPQTTDPQSQPPIAAPRETPTSAPQDRPPAPAEIRNETPSPPITAPTLPDVPPLLPAPLPDVPLPQLPPPPTLAPEAPALPPLPEPSQPVQTPTLPAVQTLP
jgi:hypothetical protein